MFRPGAALAATAAFALAAAFNGVPIVAFINEVFGTELGMSFVISPGLQEKTDLVTLRLTSPVPPRQFFSI